MLWPTCQQVSKLPKNFKVIASSQNSKFAIVENKSKNFYGVQFHPEVTHTENGKKLINNFIFKICKINKNWSSKDQKIKLIKEVRDQVGNNKVICGLSGGVDSSVVAQLLSKAIKKLPGAKAAQCESFFSKWWAWWNCECYIGVLYLEFLLYFKLSSMVPSELFIFK